jgi:hypothetical protein
MLMTGAAIARVGGLARLLRVGPGGHPVTREQTAPSLRQRQKQAASQDQRSNEPAVHMLKSTSPFKGMSSAPWRDSPAATATGISNRHSLL